jgi:hypothetical protein
MKGLLLSVILLVAINAFAQEHGFEFGKVYLRELDMKVYEKDTSAAVVALNEFGEATIANLDGEQKLIFEYHVKYKVLKASGQSIADIEIPLRKWNDEFDVLKSLEASSFNRNGSSWTESKLENKNVFNEKFNKWWVIKKFAIPNVKVGSVVEIKYVIESPQASLWNFRPWQFQTHYPKIVSEYWATIPGNYIYNMTLKGFLKLDKNEDELVKDCLTWNGSKSDCARFKFAMKDIPAMITEDYMTAPSNFLASINFELSERRFFDGRVDKYTKEWKDVEEELRKYEGFGVQLRKGRDIAEEQILKITSVEKDDLAKAKKIYEFIQSWYQWDEILSAFSHTGLKKSFTERKGNVADINLALIATLTSAGLQADPVILSTRENGLPIDVHPVINDFNYVVAQVSIAGKSYLLDATDNLLTFGMLPERCINGKGRVMASKESYWVELKPVDKRKTVSVLSLKLEDDGRITGKVQRNYIGYAAKDKRRSFLREGKDKYLEKLKTELANTEISNFTVTNAEDLSKPLSESYDIEITSSDNGASHLLFNPFVLGRWDTNPFKSQQRLYPVDFGVPREETMVFTLDLPSKYKVTDLPSSKGLSLPNAGGRYIYDLKQLQNKIILNSTLIISRTIYSSEEYHFLKELFNQIVALQNSDLVLSHQ